MRAIWKGAVSFGLVSISIKLYAATEERSIRFHQVHAEDGGRIRYQRTCTVCGKQVSYDQIAKGYQLNPDEMVILTDDDLAEVPLPSSRAIEVLEFVPADQLDPILFNRSYYLEPEEHSLRPYVLLRDALGGSDRVAIVKVALRQREQLATLQVRDQVMVMHTMLWPDEVRAPDFEVLDTGASPRAQEMAMATSLIDTMTTDFDPDAFTDDYRAALQRVIDAKVAGNEIEPAQPDQEARPAAVDLMAALSASVEAARGTGSGGGAGRPAKAPKAAGAAAKAAGGKAAGGKAAGGKQAGAAKKAGQGAKAAKSAGKAAGGKKAAPAPKKAGGRRAS